MARPVPWELPPMPRRAAMCLRPGGMAIASEVATALWDVRDRLIDAGWSVDDSRRRAATSGGGGNTRKLWLGDGFTALAAAVERDGDPGAQAIIARIRPRVEALPRRRRSACTGSASNHHPSMADISGRSIAGVAGFCENGVVGC